MEIMDAIRARHSVRQYREEPISDEHIQALQEEIEACNAESGLRIQLIQNEPKAFSGMAAHYGHFKGVRNYIAMVGTRGADLDEKAGYYGERLVLEAQRLGLNTCWVYLTYTKVPGAVSVRPGEKLAIVIAIGYGENQGSHHRSKSMDSVAEMVEPLPAWYVHGVEAALLAPTAMNQQKFRLSHDNDAVTIRPGIGICARIDMGIAKYHFEIGAGKKNFHWEESPQDALRSIFVKEKR